MPSRTARCNVVFIDVLIEHLPLARSHVEGSETDRILTSSEPRPQLHTSPKVLNMIH